MPRAEVEEEIAAGITGARCPFCDRPEARIMIERDRRGMHSASWACDACDESGPCLGDGTLYWNGDGDVA